jgi:hypothetical protein
MPLANELPSQTDTETRLRKRVVIMLFEDTDLKFGSFRSSASSYASQT